MEGEQTVTWLDIVTLAIAVGGLVLGAVTATLAVLRHRSDRVVVSVQGTVGYPIRGGRPAALLDTLYSVKAYNGGRRPVTIEAAGFDLGREGDTLPIIHFSPTRLEDGESVTATVSIVELAMAHVGPLGPVRAAWFRDAGGKKHRTPIRNPAFLTSWAEAASR